LEAVAVKEQLTRREFLHKGLLAALGAGLAACARPQRLAEIPPVEPTEADVPSPTSTFALPSGATPTKKVLLAPAAKSTLLPKELHEARYYRQLDEDWVQCQICFRRCTVAEGGRGFCRNKVNLGGRYYTLVYGHPSALQIDPIEKEPSFHMLPGATIFCTGTASCNNRCKFCHNWHLSQRSFDEIRHSAVSPEQTVELAQAWECNAVSFTYNEPTVFYEHMFDVAKAAITAGMGTLFHTNGSMNEKPLAALLEHMDAVTVDLKAFTPEFYEQVSSSQLEPVLRTLKQIYRSGVHLEIVNLVIPTLNDDMDDIRRMCRWIGDTLSADVPLHFSRFFPAFKLTSLPPTPIETLESAAQIADDEGLQYVYIGNCPGHERNSTFCPRCGEKIIKRVHFDVLSLDVEKGRCRFCGHSIPGIWWNV
jgi:pyruvate formate lyase activating enzyme